MYKPIFTIQLFKFDMSLGKELGTMIFMIIMFSCLYKFNFIIDIITIY
ncbi:hypothetical protein SAMN05444408_109182 [Chryseobacterium takakiae]|uniref:Uncharacterized protein n=1 Tax=Chryseobacterium takakiae TaxID=1302685 RepID=A0A1M4Z9A2_9FLAO|nr:hypothetical protein SAMN05444408_109182 [Chryseobacterium takakiae]